jgi:hypothetical protein
MVKLELLSDNLITIITTLLENGNLVKYISNDVTNPLESDAPQDTFGALMFSRVFPTPYNPEVTDQDYTQIRTYYSDVALEDTVIEGALINIDIICSRNLWLINVNGKPKVRPYEMAMEIVNTFNKKSVGTVGKLIIDGFHHVYVNDKFDGIQINARMTLFTTGG